MTFTNTTYAEGPFGVAVWHERGVSSRIVAVFDEIYFTPPGDFDGDGDVGPEDCAGFVNCMTGPGQAVPPTGCLPEQFDLADADNDNDVDLSDFAEFQNLFASGE